MQHDLSWQQLHWQEFLAQYDFIIEYVPGTDNTVADILSCLLANLLSSVPTVPAPSIPDPLPTVLVAPMLAISSDPTFLWDIYAVSPIDSFITKVLWNLASTSSMMVHNGLLFLRSHMVLPDVPHLHKHLFCIAHNSLSHFSTNKSYAILHSSFYWPNMHHNLEMAFILSCTECA